MQIFWDVLGIKPTTDTKKIRKAYSALVKVHNPEDDEEQFRKINSAYKAAMKFASTFAHLDLSDEQINIVDVRPDGSFGVQFKTKDGAPMFPKPPVELPEEKSFEKAVPVPEGKKLFDFGPIDSTVVTDMSQDEINSINGMIALAPGFNVPETGMTKAVKDYLNVELDVIKDLGVCPKPEDAGKAADDACTIASKFIKNEKFRGEKVLWQVYFLSPLVTSLRTNLSFFRRLETLINDEKLKPETAFAISDASPGKPRVFVHLSADKESKYAVMDFISRVPFRYIKGEYPDLDALMKTEDPAEVDKLIKFLETIPFNLYGLLMQPSPLTVDDRIADAGAAFKLIFTAPYCKEMADNRLLWKLFFGGRLNNPIIHKLSFHVFLTRRTQEIKIPRNTLEVIMKEMRCFEKVKLRRKKGENDWYYLEILANDVLARDERQKKQRIMELLGLVLGMGIGLLLILLHKILGS